MLTVVVSDLHLGTLAGADAARSGEPRERLLAALAEADRVVMLGDTLELRERPLAEALEVTRPFFEALAEVTAGKRLTLVPGNHDHALAEPWLARLRLDGTPLGPEQEWEVTAADGAAGRLAALLPETARHARLPGADAAPRRLRHPRALPRRASDDAAPGGDRRARDGAPDRPQRPGSARRGRTTRRR